MGPTAIFDTIFARRIENRGVFRSTEPEIEKTLLIFEEGPPQGQPTGTNDRNERPGRMAGTNDRDEGLGRTTGVNQRDE